MRMSVWWDITFVITIAITPMAATHVAVTLDIPSTEMGTHVMVCWLVIPPIIVN